MTVAPPPRAIQEELFPLTVPDREITSNGQARNEYGKVVEEVIPAILGVNPIKNTGTHDIVFDAFGNGFYYEIKSLYHTSKLPLYEWRRLKDREAEVPLLYAVALHRVKGASTVREVWEKMSASLRTILVIPHEVVGNLALDQKLVCLKGRENIPENTRNGYARKGYRDGYRNVSAKSLKEAAPHTLVTVTKEIRGMKFSVEVRTRIS